MRKCPKCKGTGEVKARTPVQVGKGSRVRGTGFERECAARLGLARNARNGVEAGDLAVPEGYPYSLECKRRARGFGPLYAALEQAVGYSGRTPVAIVRDDRRLTLVVLYLADAEKLLPGFDLSAKEGE